jgi:hypothetical protein
MVYIERQSMRVSVSDSSKTKWETNQFTQFPPLKTNDNTMNLSQRWV